MNLKYRHTNSLTQTSSSLAPGLIAQPPPPSPVIVSGPASSSILQGSVSCFHLILSVLTLIYRRSSMYRPYLPLTLSLLLLLLPPPELRIPDPRLYSDLAGPYGSLSDNI